jgi:DNA-3-methyladenine glycosylase II
MGDGRTSLEQTCRAADRHLRNSDPVLKRLINLHGPYTTQDTQGSMFHQLASAIIGQQLSVKAAATIQRRVMNLTSNPLSPKSYMKVGSEEVRSAGLSKSKALYIQNLATAIEQKALSKAMLKGMDDAEVIKRLTAIKGIGLWTAEMYLMFGLNRMDIVSLGDAGLQRAARQLYNKGRHRDGLLARVSEPWKPYRTVACWYLWQHADPD